MGRKRKAGSVSGKGEIWGVWRDGERAGRKRKKKRRVSGEKGRERRECEWVERGRGIYFYLHCKNVSLPLCTIFKM